MLTDERINKLISMQKFWLRLGQDSANYIRLELLDFARAVEAEVRQAQPSAQGEAVAFPAVQNAGTSLHIASAPAAPADDIDLFEDIIIKIRFENLSRAEQHEQLRRLRK